MRNHPLAPQDNAMNKALSLSAILCGCVSYTQYHGAPTSHKELLLWIQPHKDLSIADTLAACKFWAVEGVKCVLSDRETPDAIRIRIDTRPCEMVDGHWVTAYSRPYGAIMVNSACLRKGGDDIIDQDMYKVVLAHEFGHVLGVWCHVDDGDGIALMNPMIHKWMKGISVLDHDAYTHREGMKERCLNHERH